MLDLLLAFIKKFEGFRSRPYLCPAGVPTIGYGSTGRDITLKHAPVTEEWAAERATREALVYARAVAALSPILVRYPDRWAAVADFAYNLGIARYKTSTLRRKINAGDWEGAHEQIQKWVWGGGRKLPGLVRRRQAEAALLRSSKRQPGANDNASTPVQKAA